MVSIAISALRQTSFWTAEKKKITYEDLKALMDQDPNQTPKDFLESLGVSQQAVSVKLKTMKKIKKQGNWVPYKLKSRSSKAIFRRSRKKEKSGNSSYRTRLILLTLLHLITVYSNGCNSNGLRHILTVFAEIENLFKI